MGDQTLDVSNFDCDLKKKAAFIQIISDRASGAIRIRLNHKKIGKTYQHESYKEERVEMLMNFNNSGMIVEFHTQREALMLFPRKYLVQRILDLENANQYMMEIQEDGGDGAKWTV